MSYKFMINLFESLTALYAHIERSLILQVSFFSDLIINNQQLSLINYS